MPDEAKPEGTPSSESAPQATPPTPEKKDGAPPAGEQAAAPAAAKPAAPAAAKPAAPAAAKPAAPKAPAVMAAVAWESDLTAALKEEFGERILECSSYLGQNFAIVAAGSVTSVLESLRDVHDFEYLVDVTAVHWPDKPEPLELIYIVYSFSRNERVRIKTRIKEGEKPATSVPVFITADWLEREVYDMFGIEFEGHPNMKRILMPDEWATFPLRKENSILKMDQHWVRQNLGIESGQ